MITNEIEMNNKKSKGEKTLIEKITKKKKFLPIYTHNVCYKYLFFLSLVSFRIFITVVLVCLAC